MRRPAHVQGRCQGDVGLHFVARTAARFGEAPIVLFAGHPQRDCQPAQLERRQFPLLLEHAVRKLPKRAGPPELEHDLGAERRGQSEVVLGSG